jgi:hypothetical protein
MDQDLDNNIIAKYEEISVRLIKDLQQIDCPDDLEAVFRQLAKFQLAKENGRLIVKDDKILVKPDTRYANMGIMGVDMRVDQQLTEEGARIDSLKRQYRLAS